MKIACLFLTFIVLPICGISQDILNKRLSEIFLNLPIEFDPIETHNLIKDNPKFKVSKFYTYYNPTSTFLKLTYKGKINLNTIPDSIFFERHTYFVRFKDQNNVIQDTVQTRSNLELVYFNKKKAFKEFTKVVDQLKLNLPIHHFEQTLNEREFKAFILYFTELDTFNYIVVSCNTALVKNYYKIGIDFKK